MTRTQTNPDLEVVVRNWIIMLRPRSSLSFNCYRAMSVLQREGLFRCPPPPPLLLVLIDSQLRGLTGNALWRGRQKQPPAYLIYPMNKVD